MQMKKKRRQHQGGQGGWGGQGGNGFMMQEGGNGWGN